MSEDQRISQQIKHLSDEIQELKEIVLPIAETYRTASTLGQWMKGLLVFISVVFGVIMGAKNIIK